MNRIARSVRGVAQSSDHFLNNFVKHLITIFTFKKITKLFIVKPKDDLIFWHEKLNGVVIRGTMVEAYMSATFNATNLHAIISTIAMRY